MCRLFPPSSVPRAAGIGLPQGSLLIDRTASTRNEDPSISRGRVWHSGNVQARDRSGKGSSVAPLPRSVDSPWMDDSVNAGSPRCFQLLRSLPCVWFSLWKL